MNKRAMVVGMGKQGIATVYGMNKLGYRSIVIEPNVDVAISANAKLNNLKCDYAWGTHQSDADILISCAPYFANPDISQVANSKKIPYIDLGGNVPVSQKINETAQVPTFTDLGLAPGYISILGESLVKQGYDTVGLYVGGIPLFPYSCGKLKYGLTFSTDGLIGEYSGMDRVLIDSKIVNINALDGYELINLESIYFGEALEAFYTTGGMGLSIDRVAKLGAKNYSYKTLRYQGHHHLLSFLMKDSGLSKDNIKNVFENVCPKIKDDLVVIHTRAKKGDGDFVRNTKVIVGTESLTAMQQATAFPTCAIASMIVDGTIRSNLQLNYGDVDAEILEERMGKIYAN